jgi:superfamily II DNA or RNA helicase
MVARIELDDEQLEAVERMANEPTRAALNASQYGTGKTVVCVEVAERVAQDGVKLIVCPVHTWYSWKGTILRQFPTADVQIINSLKAGKKAMEDLLSLKPGWYIVGREYFATRQHGDRIAKIAEKIDFLAYDECQRWANHKSAGYRLMKRMKARYRLAMSATPGANKFSGLFAITQWLWPKLEGHQSFWTWAATWAELEEDYFAGTQVVGEKSPGAFVKSLPCYVRLEKDFGDPIEDRIEVVLSARERKIYDQIEKNMIAWIGEHPLIVKLPITMRTRLRQATLGEISYDADTETVYYDNDMKSSKYDALLGFIKEHEDEPMLILTESAKFANVVAYKLIEDGYKALPWTGDVPGEVRQRLKEAFIDGEIDYIVATIGAIGEGTDGLQHRANVMVWLSRSDNMMLNEQAFRRLHRRGQKKTVVSVDIVAIDTYDDGQLSTLTQRALDMNRSLKYED